MRGGEFSPRFEAHVELDAGRVVALCTRLLHTQHTLPKQVRGSFFAHVEKLPLVFRPQSGPCRTFEVRDLLTSLLDGELHRPRPPRGVGAIVAYEVSTRETLH